MIEDDSMEKQLGVFGIHDLGRKKGIVLFDETDETADKLLEGFVPKNK